MRRLTLVGFVSLSVLWLGGVLAGCGDNKPSQSADGSAACSGSFVSPLDGATLTEADDATTSCANGFQTNVSVATSQPDGTSVDLLIGTTKVATAKVSGAKVIFTAVQLSQGANTLKASFSSTCSLTATVTVNCNVPVCTLSKPTISATHPALNGVPVANGGDRVSSPGAAYQVEFDVATDVEDGQPVTLTITNSAAATTSTVVKGTALASKATFAGVTLSPDGTYAVEASCTNKAGHTGLSTMGMYPVDSTAPTLTISSPADGKFFGPTELTNGAFKVCAQTTSADAAGLPATLGDAAKNLSVAVGTASPDPNNGSVAVTAVGTDACVNVACTSSSPIDLTVTLKDAAGNPTVKTISQVACATSLPGVQIISPVGDSAPFSDPTKHLLAASSTNAFKDQDAVKTGAQWTVVACSDKAGMATLLGGAMGGTLAAIGTPIATVAAVPADNCPSGHTQVAKFTGATIPESQVDSSGNLSTATELRVDVADTTTAVGSSPVVDMWVDSIAPVIAPLNSAPICNTIIQSTTDKTMDLTFLASVSNVTLVVSFSSGMQMYTTPSFNVGVIKFTGVTLKLGMDTLTATAVDPAGNTGTLPQPCVVNVGTPPIVAFTAPAAGKELCANGTVSTGCVPDSDPATPGWQGNLAVTVTVTGAPATSGTVTFSAAPGGALGTATIAAGAAQLSGITIPDGAVTITATTSSLGANGVGSATEILTVDTIIPDAPGTLNAVVLDRRQTSYHLSWVAPADSGAAVAGYDIRYSLSPITDANFGAATQVASGGAAQVPGSAEARDISNLYIQTQYYFAVAALDGAGNRSLIATKTPTTTAQFNQTILQGAIAGNAFGAEIDGSEDLTGDGLSDLLVTEFNSQHVFLYPGSATFAPSAPLKTFTGQGNTFFGSYAIAAGDIDGDGKVDIAISAPGDGNGKIYLYMGGSANWSPNTIPTPNESNADFVISGDLADYQFSLGYPMARLGDINGDGIDDFAAGVSAFGGGDGRVVVILGKKPFSSFSLSDTTRTIMVNGETGLAGSFGASVIGMGAKNGTMVVGAPELGGGKVYGFKFDASSGTMVAVGTPVVGVGTSEVGTNLGLLGANGGLMIINPFLSGATASGDVDVRFGGGVNDPFAAPAVVFVDSDATPGTGAFGKIAFGGGFSGTNHQVSFIGSDKVTPDLVMGPFSENGGVTKVYIVDGSKAPALVSPADVVTKADVSVPLPADWAGSAPYNSAVVDINGDGYGDISIGEFDGGASPTFLGRVLVLW
jgi:hypothetical protein